MFLAIDRVSKFTYVEFHDKAGKMNGAAFLRNVVQVFPYKIHTVLTDNGMAFADLPKNRKRSQGQVLLHAVAGGASRRCAGRTGRRRLPETASLSLQAVEIGRRRQGARPP